MAKITIDLDDRVAERLTAVSRARNLTVEEWLREQAEQAAKPVEDFPDVYGDCRKALLDLIDNTRGDVGEQSWSRGKLYEP